MIYGCSSLKELNLSSFKTFNVTNMRYMFYGCSSLKELNISNFNNTNMKDKDDDINWMFFGCPSLKNIAALKNKIKKPNKCICF